MIVDKSSPDRTHSWQQSRVQRAALHKQETADKCWTEWAQLVMAREHWNSRLDTVKHLPLRRWASASAGIDWTAAALSRQWEAAEAVKQSLGRVVDCRRWLEAVGIVDVAEVAGIDFVVAPRQQG